MSKVNVDEIRVGDLIGFDNYDKKIALGYVTEIKTPVVGCTQFWCHFSCKKDPDRIGFLYDYNIDYHWKVINFEEEATMDDLKVYTGKETLQALLEGKTLLSDDCQCKIEGDKILYSRNGTEWFPYSMSLQSFLGYEFTEVVTPQVGDWVRVTIETGKVHVGKLIDTDSGGATAFWNNDPVRGYLGFCFEKRTWDILSPEEVSEYKREQAFVKVGRKLNEFRSGDIVCINVDGGVSVVVSNNNEESVRVHMLNVLGKGYTAKPHQLTPISFVEQRVLDIDIT